MFRSLPIRTDSSRPESSFVSQSKTEVTEFATVETGATLVEYLLLALLVLLVLVVVSTFLGTEVNKTFDNPSLKAGISG